MAGNAPAGGMNGYALAGAADEAELRELLRRSPMAGAVRLAFTREPDYFAADGLAGARDRTLICREEGRLCGVARLSVNQLYCGGMPRQVGYLGELRLAPGAKRPARLLRGGYRELRELLRGGAGGAAVDLCFTSVAATNDRARKVLEHGGRLGLPAYRPIAELVTLLLPVGQTAAAAEEEAAGEEELTEFLRPNAAPSNLALTFTAERWAALARHRLVAADFATLREQGRLVAAAAVWDLRAFRQVLVGGYHGFLEWAGPILRFLSRLGLAPPLPAVGACLEQGMIFGATVTAPRLWAPLLAALEARAARRGLRWLVIARDARDPELAMLRRLRRAREYRTRLYEVRWADGPGFGEPWGDALFRPEVALL